MRLVRIPERESGWRTVDSDSRTGSALSRRSFGDGASTVACVTHESARHVAPLSHARHGFVQRDLVSCAPLGRFHSPVRFAARPMLKERAQLPTRGWRDARLPPEARAFPRVRERAPAPSRGQRAGRVWGCGSLRRGCMPPGGQVGNPARLVSCRQTQREAVRIRISSAGAGGFVFLPFSAARILRQLRPYWFRARFLQEGRA